MGAKLTAYRREKGFTLVELLIVIVVIAILASITIVAYTGVQGRAQDSRRVSDAQSIVKAIAIYSIQNSSFPPRQSPSSWETSVAYPTSFLKPLVDSGITGSVPVDPVNNGNYQYRYYVYPAGTSGCDSSRGDFFVFEIVSGSNGYGKSPSPNSPGFSCSGRDWQSEAWWVTGGYSN